MAAGIKVTGTCHRLLQGTGEPTVLMIREKSKCTHARMKVLKQDIGAEESVVVMKFL
jgi:hypothetical protein